MPLSKIVYDHLPTTSTTGEPRRLEGGQIAARLKRVKRATGVVHNTRLAPMLAIGREQLSPCRYTDPKKGKPLVYATSRHAIEEAARKSGFDVGGRRALHDFGVAVQREHQGYAIPEYDWSTTPSLLEEGSIGLDLRERDQLGLAQTYVGAAWTGLYGRIPMLSEAERIQLLRIGSCYTPLLTLQNSPNALQVSEQLEKLACTIAPETNWERAVVANAFKEISYTRRHLGNAPSADPQKLLEVARSWADSTDHRQHFAAATYMSVLRGQAKLIAQQTINENTQISEDLQKGLLLLHLADKIAGEEPENAEMAWEWAENKAIRVQLLTAFGKNQEVIDCWNKDFESGSTTAVIEQLHYDRPEHPLYSVYGWAVIAYFLAGKQFKNAKQRAERFALETPVSLASRRGRFLGAKDAAAKEDAAGVVFFMMRSGVPRHRRGQYRQ